MKERVEIRDGREFTVTRLPPDKRSTPSAARERTLFQKLTGPQKSAHIRQRIARAKKRKRKARASAAKRTSG